MGLAARLVAAVVVLPAATALAPPLPVLDASAVAATLWRQRELWATDVHGLVRCGGEGEPRFRLAYMPIRNRAESIAHCWKYLLVEDPLAHTQKKERRGRRGDATRPAASASSRTQ
jgi:hypothetical protein